MAEPAGRADHHALEREQRSRLASIQAAFASLQKADMKTKLMAGRRERTAQGLPNGGHAPYGYERAARTTRGERPRPFAVSHTEAETYGQMIQGTIEGHGSAWITHRLSCSTDELTQCLLDLRWQRALDRRRGRDDLRRGYLLHGGSSCPRGLGWRLSRSQHERT